MGIVFGYGDGVYGNGTYGGFYCGDGVCNNEESCSSCSVDCGACSVIDTGNNGGGGSSGGSSDGGFGSCGEGYEFLNGSCVLVLNESVEGDEVLDEIEEEEVGVGLITGEVVGGVGVDGENGMFWLGVVFGVLGLSYVGWRVFLRKEEGEF